MNLYEKIHVKLEKSHADVLYFRKDSAPMSRKVCLIFQNPDNPFISKERICKTSSHASGQNGTAYISVYYLVDFAKN